MQKLLELLRSSKFLIIWISVAIFLALLINHRHRNTGTFNWTTPLWADQVGYYVYLPGLFIYHFDPESFPENIEEKTGGGFSLDLVNEKVITRYTCGIAILQAPFFIFIHFLAGIKDQAQDGFSGIYHHVPNLAAWFYCILGFFFLWKFLLFYFKQRVALLTIAALFFGTNLYYYAVDSTGMSHIYSFALFAIVAWLSKKIISEEIKNRNLYFACWSLIFSLIVLVRPTNILIFPFLFCLDCLSLNELRQRIKRFLTLRNILILIVSFLIIFLPQFLYWKYASGNYITDSYKGFGFSNWKSPKILELLFSPNNGLFLYSPFYLVALSGLFLMIWRKIANGWSILLTFVTITYVFASWFIFSFGCGFGSRNYVEYLVLFAVPVGYLFSWLGKLSSMKKSVLITLFVILVAFNLRLVYSYNRCYSGDWDFQEYVSFLVKVRKYHQSLDMDGSEHMGPDNEYSKKMYLAANKISHLKYKTAIVKTEVCLESVNSEALMVLVIGISDSTLYWSTIRLKDKISDRNLNKNKTVECEFYIPTYLPENAMIAAYIWNISKESLTVSKLDLYLA